MFASPLRLWNYRCFLLFWLYWHSVFHIYGLYHIYIYIRSAFYVFLWEGGGGQWTSVLCSPSSRSFCVFSDDVDIFGWNSRWSSSFCVFKCFCSLLGFMSDDYSFVVAFVVYLFNMDIYLYISMYIQAEYRRFGVFIFYYVISCTCYIFFIVACCFITAAGGRGVFVYFRQTACISFIIQ